MDSNFMKSCTICLLIASVITLRTPPEARSQGAPDLINYQGRLTDASGSPLRDGAYVVAFRLWTNGAKTDGEGMIWGQEYGVTLINGVFNVILGASGGTPIAGASVNDLAFAFTEPNRFLGLTVLTGRDGQSIPGAREVAPRQQLLSTPFSFVAANGVPKGGIIMWSGSTSDVPSGFLLCDGRSGTPDLRDRFIVGAAGKYSPGSLGGSETGRTLGHALTIAEMPEHKHFYHPRAGAPGGIGSSDSRSSDGGEASSIQTDATGGGQAHAHELDPTTKLPPYYALAFIIKK